MDYNEFSAALLAVSLSRLKDYFQSHKIKKSIDKLAILDNCIFACQVGVDDYHGIIEDWNSDARIPVIEIRSIPPISQLSHFDEILVYQTYKLFV